MHKVVATTANKTISTPTTIKEHMTTKYLTSQLTTGTSLILQNSTTFAKEYTSRCHQNGTPTTKSTSISTGMHSKSIEQNQSEQFMTSNSNAKSTAKSTSTSSGIHRNSTERNHIEHLITSNSSGFPPFMKCLYFIVFIRGTLWHNLFGMKTKI